jgi:VWFA-related protein
MTGHRLAGSKTERPAKGAMTDVELLALPVDTDLTGGARAVRSPLRTRIPGHAAACVSALFAYGVVLHGQLPQFRAGVALTRIEVRVVDGEGRPVRDLSSADFTVKEDGIVQKVELFEAVAADDPNPASAGRVFVFVLGRGRLNAPTNALQALIDFVRSRCLPADQIGVIAYLKAIEPTTDHGAVVRFLETFRARHVRIEGKLRRDRMAQAITAETRALIDGLFEDPALRVRDLAAGAGHNVGKFYDWMYLKQALAYLRVVDGEKHVMIVTERPLINVHLKDKPVENYWIRQAAVARAALSFVHAGGLKAPQTNVGRFSSIQPAFGFEPGFIDDQQWLAEQLGGTATFFQAASRPLAALDQSTRFVYVLGYYPLREVTPDQYRVIEVTTTRPGARLVYRHGYQARPASDESQDYRQVVTEARIDEAAFRLVHPVASVTPGGGKPAVSLRVVKEGIPAASGILRATVIVDPSLIYFKEEGNRYFAELDVRLIADDAQRDIVGERTQRVPLVLTADEFQRSQRRVRPQSLTFDVSVDVTSRPTFLRGVVYQFETDRVVSGQLRLPR